jgi:hypothetical protein
MDGRVRLGIIAALIVLALLIGYRAYRVFEEPTTRVYQVPAWGWVSWAGWDYSVFLKPNTLYSTRELGPDLTYYESLVDGLEARLSYNFATDIPTRIEGWYDITTDLAGGKLLNEGATLVPRTPFEKEGKSVNVGLVMPIDREAFRRRIKEMARETGLEPGTDPKVTYTAHIEARAFTKTESARQSQEISLVVPLTGVTFAISGDRSAKKSGVIRRDEERPISGVRSRWRKVLGSAAALALVPALFALVTSARPRLHGGPLAHGARDAQRIRRKYRKRIVEAGKGESALPGGEVVAVASIEDLARVSAELLKPIIYRAPGDQEEEHLFYIIDGATRYQYALTGEEVVGLASMEDLARVSAELLKPILYRAPRDQQEEHLFYIVAGATRYQYALARPGGHETEGGC